MIACGRLIVGTHPQRYCGMPGPRGQAGKLCSRCTAKRESERAAIADLPGAVPAVEILDVSTEETIAATLAEPTIEVGDDVRFGIRGATPSWMRVTATDPKGWTQLEGGPAPTTKLRLTTYSLLALLRLRAAFVRREAKGEQR